ncbi:MAG: glycosyltransferase [Thiohalocapsa sp.]|nr:glycosyltransferase [Thiohalocapsa sp.]
MSASATSNRVAIFAATSGHSGVDRVVANLAAQFDEWAIPVDLLRIRGHGPDVALEGMRHARRIDLGAAHVNTALPALVRYLRRERPAALLTDKDRVNRVAIIARMLAGAGAAADMPATRLAVRLGTTVSVNLASRGALERRLQQASIRRLYPLADCIVVPSQGVADDLVSALGVEPALIRVAYSPIVSDRLRTLSLAAVDHPWLADGAPPVILGVGELGARKDFATLVRAFALLRARRPCRLLILGRGRQRERLLALAAESGVAGDVELAGFHDNPYAFMARAALFVLSSRWEGFGIVLAEALACGTPVVSTDCPSGPAEILDGSRHQRLVPVGDSDALAAAMADALSVRPDREALRRGAERFSTEASARAYLAALGLSEAVPRPVSAPG